MSNMQHETTTDELDALQTDDGGIDARQAIGRFDEEPRQNNDDSAYTVTTEQCERWRRTIRRPQVTLTSIGKRAGLDPSSVRYHIRDACTHEVDEPRVTEDLR